MAMSSLLHLAVPKAPSRTHAGKGVSLAAVPRKYFHHRISLLDRGEERTCTSTLYIIEYNEVQDSRRKALNELMP